MQAEEHLVSAQSVREVNGGTAVGIVPANTAGRYKVSLNITNHMRIVCNHTTVTDVRGLTEQQSERIKERGL